MAFIKKFYREQIIGVKIWKPKDLINAIKKDLAQSTKKPFTITRVKPSQDAQIVNGDFSSAAMSERIPLAETKTLQLNYVPHHHTQKLLDSIPPHRYHYFITQILSPSTKSNKNPLELMLSITPVHPASQKAWQKLTDDLLTTLYHDPLGRAFLRGLLSQKNQEGATLSDVALRHGKTHFVKRLNNLQQRIDTHLFHGGNPHVKEFLKQTSHIAKENPSNALLQAEETQQQQPQSKADAQIIKLLRTNKQTPMAV